MNWKDIKKLIKEEGYTDERIQKVKQQMKNKFGDHLGDKNLLWRKIALELGVKIADDQLSSSRESRKVTVEELKKGDPETDDVNYELEGFFYDIDRDDATSSGKPKTSFKFCDGTDIIPGAVYGEQDIAQEIEACKWYKVQGASRYKPVNDMLLTIGKYSDVIEKDMDVEEKVNESAIGRFEGLEDIPFELGADGRTKKTKWVHGLVTDDDLGAYMGCTKETDMGTCNYGFDEDGTCKREGCDGELEKDGEQMYFYTMKIHVTGIGGYEFQMGPEVATGQEDYKGQPIEGVAEIYNEESLTMLSVRVLGTEENKRVKQRRLQENMQEQKSDEDEWTEEMEALHQFLADGKVYGTSEIADELGCSRGDVVSAATQLEEELGVIEYPEAGVITREDVETPQGEKEDTVEFDDDTLKKIYNALADGRIWTSEALASRFDEIAEEQVGGLLNDIQTEVDTIEFPSFGEFRRTDVVNSNEKVQPEEYQDTSTDDGDEDEDDSEGEDTSTDDEDEDEDDSEGEDTSTDDEDDEDKEFECDECGKTYQTKGWLKRHKNQEHSDDAEEEQEDTSTDDEDKDEDGSEEEDTSTDDEDEYGDRILTVEEVEDSIKEGVDETLKEAVVQTYKWMKQFKEAPISGVEKKLKGDFDLDDDGVNKIEVTLEDLPCVEVDDLMYRVVGEEE